MYKVLDPGKERRSINVLDHVCFSHVTDLEGNPLDLYMTLMLQNGNSEMRLADGRDDEVSTGVQPCIVWINGSGWRKCDRLLMAAEMEFLAEAGFAVAFAEYRHSGQGHDPAQVQDLKTAIRFLREHAAEYGIDPDRIGTIGRSAGGHLSAWMAMNTDGFDTEEWSDQSSRIQAAVNMFGPTDLEICSRINYSKFDDLCYRWHHISETHEGAYLGATDETTEEEALAMGRAASPIYAVNDGMAPMLILHGDQDPLVPHEISEKLYHTIVEAGLESRVDMCTIKNGGHGTSLSVSFLSGQTVKEFLWNPPGQDVKCYPGGFYYSTEGYSGNMGIGFPYSSTGRFPVIYSFARRIRYRSGLVR